MGAAVGRVRAAAGWKGRRRASGGTVGRVLRRAERGAAAVAATLTASLSSSSEEAATPSRANRFCKTKETDNWVWSSSSRARTQQNSARVALIGRSHFWAVMKVKAAIRPGTTVLRANHRFRIIGKMAAENAMLIYSLSSSQNKGEVGEGLECVRRSWQVPLGKRDLLPAATAGASSQPGGGQAGPLPGHSWVKRGRARPGRQRRAAPARRRPFDGAGSGPRPDCRRP
jgi:hypothetical protein